ncbi:MAG TPA: phosphatidate cytidylyltransferase [Nitrospiria bacterium]|nr:phosphatidate cytidylyltransferase [Nitrospiria bacterium]
MGVMARRVVVALVVLPLLYAVIRYAPPVALFALVAATVIIAQREFYRLFFPKTAPWRLAVGLLLGGVAVWSLYRMGGGRLLGAAPVITALLAGGVTAVLLVELFTGRRLATALPAWGFWLFGALYLGVMLGHLVLLRSLERGADVVLFVLTVTWVVDSAAYFVGRRWGRHPLAPAISPKKTIEGAVAGLAGGVVTALVLRAWWTPALSGLDSFGAGVLLGCAGQLGDLAESMFKRRAGVKDSGGWIPGHGGLLDKVDSLVFAAPTFYYYLLWVKDL